MSHNESYFRMVTTNFIILFVSEFCCPWRFNNDWSNFENNSFWRNSRNSPVQPINQAQILLIDISHSTYMYVYMSHCVTQCKSLSPSRACTPIMPSPRSPVCPETRKIVIPKRMNTQWLLKVHDAELAAYVEANPERYDVIITHFN